MAKLDVVNTENKKTGSVDLRDEVFGVKPNIALVHQVIKAQLAGRRRGTAKTKTRSEVQGGGKKPFKQKGTGNARQGSSRSPNQPGGGEAHGPVPRSYEQATPKEMIRGALRSAISDRVKAKQFLVVDEFKMKEIKTKTFDQIRQKLSLKNALIVDERNENLELSGRNIPNVKVLRAEGLNVYDVVRHDWLVMSKKAALTINDRLAPGKEGKALRRKTSQASPAAS